ncbi:MAG: hypothetical protein KJO91_01340, partial [Gammaproteobacteria bacterium]|nr:hypothetical protein [Gammaproteobacteria bacterium]
MNDSNNNPGNTPSKRTWLFPLAVAAIAISSVVVVSCFHDDDSTSTTFFDDGGEGPVSTEPPPLEVVGSSLFCDTTKVNTGSTVASTLKVEMPDGIQAINISSNEADDSTNNHNAANNLERLSTTVVAQTPTGAAAVVDDGPDGIPDTGDEVAIGDVHPLIVSYGEQVLCDPAKLPVGQVCNEGGDGSADIADPNHVDDIFTSLSLDNGKSWKKVKVGDTADKWSKPVTWGPLGAINYPGHSHKPTMAIQDNNILVAWNDKYCPSGNLFDLELVDGTYPDDYYKVNGTQGTVDYGGEIAPNDKPLYEVPYSCVWTARGEFVLDPDPAVQDAAEVPVYTIQWRQAQQLTSGTRDSNKIWIAPAPVGFAITWQEDPDGLRPGKGAGPGVGYSGATTNHGADIWYTYIDMNDFDDVCAQLTADDPDCTAVKEDPTPAEILALGEKPKPAKNFAIPVRITNNEVCIEGDAKPYCEDPEARNCVSTVAVTSVSGKTTNRCVQDDLDYMVPGASDATVVPVDAVLDGDTGASRPALKILRTNAETLDAENEPEYVAILAYEETKGLSESSQGDQDQGTVDTDIALEGKAVYFESFFWNKPEFAAVSAGRVVNLHVPDVDIAYDDNNVITSINETGLDVYENARRVVIMGQVDACEMADGDYTFGLLYKQGFDTRGGPSDMY